MRREVFFVYNGRMAQLGLFDEIEKPDLSVELSLSQRTPRQVLFGTSSWTFSGWSGLVYPRGTDEALLRERGLSLYCDNPLFRTVGIDSSYYRPLEAKQLRRYRAQLPIGFRCVSKVYSGYSTRCDVRTLEPNPHFLHARSFEEAVLRPIADEFFEQQGPLVLEFPELPHAPPLDAKDFAEQLDAFLSKVSRDFQYAVELRDRTLLSPHYLEVLHRHRAAHVFNYWERMPGLAEQFERIGTDCAPFGVVRLLIPPGQRYADRKKQLAPFDRLVDRRPEMRRETIEIARAYVELDSPLFVIVNNKAEGSSPLTVRELARELSDALSA